MPPKRLMRYANMCLATELINSIIIAMGKVSGFMYHNKWMLYPFALNHTKRYIYSSDNLFVLHLSTDLRAFPKYVYCITCSKSHGEAEDNDYFKIISIDLVSRCSSLANELPYNVHRNVFWDQVGDDHLTSILRYMCM